MSDSTNLPCLDACNETLVASEHEGVENNATCDSMCDDLEPCDIKGGRKPCRRSSRNWTAGSGLCAEYRRKYNLESMDSLASTEFPHHDGEELVKSVMPCVKQAIKEEVDRIAKQMNVMHEDLVSLLRCALRSSSGGSHSSGSLTRGSCKSSSWFSLRAGFNQVTDKIYQNDPFLSGAASAGFNQVTDKTYQNDPFLSGAAAAGAVLSCPGNIACPDFEEMEKAIRVPQKAPDRTRSNGAGEISVSWPKSCPGSWCKETIEEEPLPDTLHYSDGASPSSA